MIYYLVGAYLLGVGIFSVSVACWKLVRYIKYILLRS